MGRSFQRGGLCTHYPGRGGGEGISNISFEKRSSGRQREGTAYTAHKIRPQFASCPYNAVLTSAEVATEQATARETSYDGPFYRVREWEKGEVCALVDSQIHGGKVG